MWVVIDMQAIFSAESQGHSATHLADADIWIALNVSAEWSSFSQTHDERNHEGEPRLAIDGIRGAYVNLFLHQLLM